MSAPDVDTAAKPAVIKPVKPIKKAAAKPKKPAAHPKYTEMIAAALGSLNERGGSSRQAVLKYIMSQYNVGKDERVVNQHLKMALRAGVKNGSLKQAKGTGASGSFRLSEKVAPKKATSKKPKAASAAKKLKKAKTSKKANTSKKTTAKKPAAKKLKSAAKPKSKKTVNKATKSNTTTAKKLKATKTKKTPVKKLAKKA